MQICSDIYSNFFVFLHLLSCKGSIPSQNVYPVIEAWPVEIHHQYSAKPSDAYHMFPCPRYIKISHNALHPGTDTTTNMA